MAVDKFPVEFSHIMMFARSVGDYNPIYHDPEYARTTEFGAVIAPPTFVQASAQFDPECPLRPHPDKPWYGSGKEPTSAKSGGGDGEAHAGWLHAEQHYEYHRVLRAGDVLSSTQRLGDSWEKEGRRGGKLLFMEKIIEYRDEKGELVVTVRDVSVRTERPADQA